MLSGVPKINTNLPFCKSNTIFTANNATYPQINTLTNPTVSFNIQAPQTYNKLGVEKLTNGQEIHCYKLANGQKVFIAPMKTPKTHINTYINTGATNEIDSQRGISHFCEHMLFNGTSGTNGYMKLSTGDVFRKVEEMGGYTNACTGPAQTSYTIEVPSEKQNIEKAIQIQSAMMFNCSMSDDMVKKEHYPVCSEINMYSDMADIKANNIAIKNLYNINSTSEDIVAGRVDNIKNIDHKKVMDYYKQNYTPDNMTTVITGDVSPDEAIKLVAKNFKEPAKSSPNKRTFENLTPITKTVRQDLVSPKTLATCATIAFNGPENSNLKDQIALELVLDILFDKSNSRISTPLKELNTNIEPSVSKLGTLPTNGQIITFDIDTNEKYSEKTLQKIFSELNNFKIKDQNELEAIKQHKLAQNQDLYEDARYINRLIGANSFDFTTNSITQMDNIVKSLTIQDLENVRKKYLDTSKASLVVIHPTGVTQESLTQNYNSARSISFKGNRISTDKPINTNDITTNTLYNNYNIGFYNTPTNNNAKIGIKYTPIKTIVAKPGTIEILNKILNNKTAYKNISAFGDYLDNAGISQDIKIKKDGSIEIHGNMPGKSVQQFINITQEQLMLPAFDHETFSGIKEIVKSNLQTLKSNPKEAINKVMYGDSTLGYTTKDILANIDNVTLDDVKQLYSDIMQNSTATVAVATTMDENIKSIVNNSFAQMPIVQKQTHALKQTHKTIEKSTVETTTEPNAQAEIIQAYNFKTSNNIEDDIKFSLMNQILCRGDETGLFNNLREKEKLAYAVHSQYETRGNNSVISCHILTTTDNEDTKEYTPENVQKSINGFTKQINKMKNGEFSEKELEAAKKELKITLKELTYKQQFKENALLNGLNSPYGVDLLNKKYELIDQIRKADIQCAAQYAFGGKPIYAITASQKTLDANKEFFQQITK